MHGRVSGVKRIKKFLRTPRGASVAGSWSLITVGCVAFAVLHVPGRWLPDGTPVWLAFAIGCAPGVLLGWLGNVFGGEIGRWALLRDEYAAAQRDIERLERGER